MPVDLLKLAPMHRSGHPAGITSVCCAHRTVLRAALRFARNSNSPVLIEATCNQVNHLGGYTGMTPAGFSELVKSIADQEGCPHQSILLGGDHLGPSPWRHLSIETAMAHAEKMVAAYVNAGFSKIHVDTSMATKADPPTLDDATVAERAAQLVTIAETTAAQAGIAPPLYVIGTEVPPPGGADHLLDELTPTTYEAAEKTLRVHRNHFSDRVLDDAFSRVLAIVVQPGVEFGNLNAVAYDRNKARMLVRLLDVEDKIVFEAHSTDYQPGSVLKNLVEDGFAILKVGPELTFALRQAYYGLDHIAGEIFPGYGDRALYHALERVMLAEPKYWNSHYSGGDNERRLLRHYSLSDRIRYYWHFEEVVQAVDTLSRTITGTSIPAALIKQYLPEAADFSDQPLDPEDVLIEYVNVVLKKYHSACRVR